MGSTGIKKWLAMVAAVVFLSACGGGDGDGGNNDTGPIGIGGPMIPDSTPTPTPTSGGLANLLGTVTFRRNFSGDSTVFTSVAQFTSNSYNTDSDGNQILAEANTTGDSAIVCADLDVAGDVYLCTIVYLDAAGVLDAAELLLFELTSTTAGGGVFEFCTDGELAGSVCVEELTNTPDGPLTVSIQGGVAKVDSAQLVDNVPVTPSEAEVHMHAAELQFGGQASAFNTDLALDAESVNLVMEKLSQVLHQVSQ